MADEVYERVWFGPGRAAPSFLDHAAPDDRVVVVGSFSKAFLMTGWRLGWLVLPRGHLDTAGALIEFNSSCAPVFVQRGGLGRAGDGGRLRARPGRAAQGRPATPCARPWPGCRACSPPRRWAACTRGFARRGAGDSLAFAKHLVTGHGLGLAPGAAFGAEGEGWLRWCFASQDTARLHQGVARLRQALGL